MPMKTVKGQLTLGRFDVPYRVYGEAGRTIVCISGAKQTMAAWRSFVSHFVSDYSVVVFDLPGQGRSQILSGLPAVSFDEQVDVLCSVVESTNRNGSVNLAAASWGTIIAAALAARRPELVDKMILGSFGAKPSKAVIEVIKAGQRLFDGGRTNEIAPLMIKNFGKYIPEYHKKKMIDQFRHMSHEQFMSFYEHCSFIEQASDIAEFVDLASIRASTLIVSGEYDSILDLADIEEASLRIPDCEFRLVRGAGHFLHWEKVDILHIYSDFLAR